MTPLSTRPPAVAEPSGGERVAYDRVAARASMSRRLVRWVMHRCLRALTLVHAAVLRLAGAIGPPLRQPPPEGADILLTGTFYADNWVAAHLVPLAASARCRRLRVVTSYPGGALPGVEWVRPSRWLRPILGGTGARLATFVARAVVDRPHLVGGFHLLLNGLVALPLARLIGARSIYFCGGGPTEVLDGGVWGQNRLFTLMETPDAVVERRLLRAVSRFDLVITMGRRAIDFFRSRGATTRYHVVSGGMDTSRFAPSPAAASADLVFVARLSAVKRVDLFLGVVAHLARARPRTSAIVVGDGPLLEPLKRQAAAEGIEGNVSFVGHQKDVEGWLRRARVFVLTSDSEGLSLALMEAMLCGLPAVVSDVGDLPELVEDGRNGYLVRERSVQAFAEPLLRLLEDPALLARFSTAARSAALEYGVERTVERWDAILAFDAHSK